MDSLVETLGESGGTPPLQAGRGAPMMQRSFTLKHGETFPSACTNRYLSLVVESDSRSSAASVFCFLTFSALNVEKEEEEL